MTRHVHTLGADGAACLECGKPVPQKPGPTPASPPIALLRPRPGFVDERAGSVWERAARLARTPKRVIGEQAVGFDARKRAGGDDS